MSRSPLIRSARLAIVCATTCLCPLLHAQLAPPAEGPDHGIIEALFEATDQAALDAAIAGARRAGVAPQAILEARFIFLVDQQDHAALGRLGAELEKKRESFRVEDSVIFSVPEEFDAITEYCHALAALQKGDNVAFKKHITEAFWLSPRQAASFGPHIERLRRQEAMKDLEIDLAQSFLHQSDLKRVTLSALTGESTLLLLHFWSPWSSECEANLPDFVAMTKELLKNRIAVVSVLAQPGAEAREAARAFRNAIEEKNVGEWIVDNSSSPLAGPLRIQDIPTVVLLDRKGAVLFNGHPSESDLWDALKKAVPKITRPALAPAMEGQDGVVPK